MVESTFWFHPSTPIKNPQQIRAVYEGGDQKAGSTHPTTFTLVSETGAASGLSGG